MTALSDLGFAAARFVTDLGRLARFAAQIGRAARAPPLRVRLFLDELFKRGGLSLATHCVRGRVVGGYRVGGGVLGGDAGGDMSRVRSAVDVRDAVLGSLLKALIFGGLRGLIATCRGPPTGPPSAGVGAATTAPVVVAS